ncbi:hypothetical protein KUTeg_013998 [Tegillarca granosa]|uniref:Cysteine-rich motor neuron 1 protein n=1 Tax=Tegillarca granosa TaxID=220873 RepID=A0ABQ9EVC0_TEGGR|nr:hypothetical protein KUTeg_013998 [Tegillarca granosa]
MLNKAFAVCHACSLLHSEPRALNWLSSNQATKSTFTSDVDTYLITDFLETNLNCEYNGEIYKDGETWKLDECRICTCNRGLKFCKTETCNNISLCPYMEIPDGACCHVCKGCITDSKKIYNNSDVWKEGDCTTCHCIGGEIQCKSQHCATKCLNPRRVPGQCCPICDDDESSRQQPSTCPDMRNCSLLCPSGFQMLQDGCYRCKCKPVFLCYFTLENCYLDCEHGYIRDEKGIEKCECALPETPCPSVAFCNKQCTYGFKKSQNGCPKCRCNKCPTFECTKRCAHGHVVNNQGCRICKCRESATIPSKSNPNVFGKPCFSTDGSHHEDGDSWHDGCRLCYCYNGREMCSLISCPRPSCSNPVFRLADCCPTCPGNAILPPTTGKQESCQSANGGYYLEGETWFLDNCTECICHDGSVLCETRACPPFLYVNYPKFCKVDDMSKYTPQPDTNKPDDQLQKLDFCIIYSLTFYFKNDIMKNKELKEIHK